MNNELYEGITKLGFLPYTAVNIEYPTVTLVGVVPSTGAFNNIYLKYENTKDFVVIFPTMGNGKWRVACYGETEHIKQKLIELEKEVL